MAKKMDILGSYISLKNIVRIGNIRKWFIVDPYFKVETIDGDIKISSKKYEDVVEARQTLAKSFEEYLGA